MMRSGFFKIISSSKKEECVVMHYIKTRIQTYSHPCANVQLRVKVSCPLRLLLIRPVKVLIKSTGYMYKYVGWTEY